MMTFGVCLLCSFPIVMDLSTQNKHYGVTASTGAIQYTRTVNSAHDGLRKEELNTDNEMLQKGDTV